MLNGGGNEPGEIEMKKGIIESYVSMLSYHCHMALVEQLEYKSSIESFFAFEQHILRACLSQLQIDLLLST